MVLNLLGLGETNIGYKAKLLQYCQRIATRLCSDSELWITLLSVLLNAILLLF